MLFVTRRVVVLMCFCIFLVVQSLSAIAADITVSWNENQEDTLAGYRIYCGEQSHDYQVIDDAGADTRHTLTGLQEGTTYYIAATAYDIYGEESDFSEEITHTVQVEEIPQPDPEPEPQDDMLIETGEVTTDASWTTVTLTKNFTNPIVIANLPGFQGTDPSTVRLRNVTSTGFEISVQEWDYLDVTHAVETIGYVVVEKGNYILSDGTRVQAGTFSTAQSTRFENVAFTTSFPSVPVVTTSITTTTDKAAVVGRIQNVSTEGFEYCMQEQEKNTQDHANETIMYIAWEESRGTIDTLSYEVHIAQDPCNVQFETVYMNSFFDNTPVFTAQMQTFCGSDPATLRYQNKRNDSIDIMIEEEKSRDTEMIHSDETLGYMAFSLESTSEETVDPGDGTTNPDEDSDTSDDADDADVTDNDLQMTVGEVAIDHTWTTVTFDQTFEDPIVVSTGLSYEGTDPSTIRIRNVTSNGFEISVQEWDYLNIDHATETVGYIVLERGVTILDDGSIIHADSITTDATNTFEEIVFSQQMSDKPVVLASVTTMNGNSAITTRVKNIATSGFEIGMQEEEKNDQVHSTEIISFIAWEASSGMIDDRTFEVGRTADIVDENMSALSFATNFSQTPIFIGGMQTFNGIDPASLRYSELTETGCTIMVEEERSLDPEMVHSEESVGYIVFDR